MGDAGVRGRTSGFQTALMSFLGFATGAVSGGSLGCAGAAGAGASGGGAASCGSGPVSLIGACRIGPYRLHVQVPVFLIASFGLFLAPPSGVSRMHHARFRYVSLARNKWQNEEGVWRLQTRRLSPFFDNRFGNQGLADRILFTRFRETARVAVCVIINTRVW